MKTARVRGGGVVGGERTEVGWGHRGWGLGVCSPRKHMLRKNPKHSHYDSLYLRYLSPTLQPLSPTLEAPASAWWAGSETRQPQSADCTWVEKQRGEGGRGETRWFCENIVRVCTCKQKNIIITPRFVQHDTATKAVLPFWNCICACSGSLTSSSLSPLLRLTSATSATLLQRESSTFFGVTANGAGGPCCVQMSPQAFTMHTVNCQFFSLRCPTLTELNCSFTFQKVQSKSNKQWLALTCTGSHSFLRSASQSDSCTHQTVILEKSKLSHTLQGLITDARMVYTHTHTNMNSSLHWGGFKEISHLQQTRCMRPLARCSNSPFNHSRTLCLHIDTQIQMHACTHPCTGLNSKTENKRCFFPPRLTSVRCTATPVCAGCGNPSSPQCLCLPFFSPAPQPVVIAWL